ncbi:MAG: hypothetical protein NTX45_14310 [Proteobacteria bacterium]|nr:hypothetical protein [Pseudomonadota bacterium]
MPNPLQKNSSFHLLALAFLAAALFTASVRSEETSKAPALDKPDGSSPWGFNLTTYLWLPGVDGSFSAGQRTGSVDVNFIDVVGKSRRVPLGFMGRFEAHYDRFAFYLDGNYINLQLKPAFGRVSEGINTELGLMDYGLMYRIFGAKASEIRDYQGKKRPNRLDVYVGARTLWLDNSVSFSGPGGLIQRTPSSSHSFTSPLIGGRIGFDLTPNWYVMTDFNFGGFGVQSVDFTGSVMGELGYRTTFFNIPTSLEAGYKAVRYQVDRDGPTATSATLNGPFIGLTGNW